MSELHPERLINIPNLTRLFADRRKLRTEAHERALYSGRFDAELAFGILAQKMKRFQSTLEADEEIGLQLANFGLASQIRIREIGFENPNLILFRGVDGEGQDVELVQHISQLNFIFRAIKVVDNVPYRIGFIQEEEDKTDGAQNTETPAKEA